MPFNDEYIYICGWELMMEIFSEKTWDTHLINMIHIVYKHTHNQNIILWRVCLFVCSNGILFHTYRRNLFIVSSNEPVMWIEPCQIHGKFGDEIKLSIYSKRNVFYFVVRYWHFISCISLFVVFFPNWVICFISSLSLCLYLESLRFSRTSTHIHTCDLLSTVCFLNICLPVFFIFFSFCFTQSFTLE